MTTLADGTVIVPISETFAVERPWHQIRVATEQPDGISPKEVLFGYVRFSDTFGTAVPSIVTAQLVLSLPLILIDFLPTLDPAVWQARLYGGEAGVAYPALLLLPGRLPYALSLVVHNPVTEQPTVTAAIVGEAVDGQDWVVGEDQTGALVDIGGEQVF